MSLSPDRASDHTAVELKEMLENPPPEEALDMDSLAASLAGML